MFNDHSFEENIVIKGEEEDDDDDTLLLRAATEEELKLLFDVWKSGAHPLFIIKASPHYRGLK